MTVVAVSLTVTIDHEPGLMLAAEDLVLRVVEEAFEETCGAGVASVVIDDVNAANRHPISLDSGDET